MNRMRNWPPPVEHLPRIDIYAYLDAAGDVLYIGQSIDLPSRNLAHSANSAWFDLATDFALIGVCHSGDHAREAEAAAIRMYRPRFNVQHNRGQVPA